MGYENNVTPLLNLLRKYLNIDIYLSQECRKRCKQTMQLKILD